MADRFLAWLSAGVLVAGVSAGTILGAGLAFADDDPSGDAGTSQSASPDTQSDSEVDNTEVDPPAQEDDEEAPDDVVEDDDEEEDPAEDVDEPTAKPGDDEVDEPAAVESKSDTVVTRSVVVTRPEPEPDPEPDPTPVKTEKVEEPEESIVAAPAETVTVDAPVIDEVEPSPATARVMMTAAADVPAPARPSLINVIGTLAWSVADFFINLVVGPPVVPPGYSVTAGRSTLKIDCGDGYHAQADWYFPTSGEPDKLIYFQHGFLSPAATYNVTLTELAERNNAIVVAPSITSNYFSCDGCSVTADLMHLAVAKLFAGDRTALQESAAAAGFEGTLPTQFALAGHSAGSMLAAGTSGYYYERAPEEQKADLVGVLLYDGSAANGALGRALDKLPDAVPVLNIAGGPTVFNNGGEANQVFSEMRPDQFNGVQLVGGAHSDGFRSSIYGGLVQAFVGLAFGQSQPQNVEAVQVLTQGWLADMFAGRVYDEDSRTGIYGDVGEIIDIDTDAGLARGYVLPGPLATLSPIERFFATLLHSINSNDFVVRPPTDVETLNTLTYTPPPSFFDGFNLIAQEVMRFVTKVTGVNVQMLLGQVMASDAPPFFLGFGLDSRRTTWEADDGTAWRVWEFDAPGESEKTVVAFHGGGFIIEPSILNWLDYTNMARQTGATVIVPLYPLATTEAGRATEVVPDAADFIADQIATRGADNVSVYGDSAGSLIAMLAVRQLLLAGEPVPSTMVLISLVADSSLSNEDISEVDDPIFDVTNVQDVWQSHWYDGIADRRDPFISPLFFEPEVFAGLPPTTIYVAQREILYPDTLLLHQRAVDAGVPISVVVGTGLIHNWAQDPGVPFLGSSQTTAVRPDILRRLGLRDRQV